VSYQLVGRGKGREARRRALGWVGLVPDGDGGVAGARSQRRKRVRGAVRRCASRELGDRVVEVGPRCRTRGTRTGSAARRGAGEVVDWTTGVLYSTRPRLGGRRHLCVR
jgi:hypothetical protein